VDKYANRFRRDAPPFGVLDDVFAINGPRIDVLADHAASVIHHGSEERFIEVSMLLPSAALRHFEIFADKPQRNRVNGNKQ